MPGMTISGTGRIGKAKAKYTIRREGDDVVFEFDTTGDGPFAPGAVIDRAVFGFRIPVKHMAAVKQLIDDDVM
jgi:hypothetical protein